MKQNEIYVKETTRLKSELDKEKKVKVKPSIVNTKEVIAENQN